MNKILMVLMVSAILLAAGAVSATAGINVFVDDAKVAFPDQVPFIDENARTLVPIRFIAEEMGAEVGWDGKINLVTIEDKDVTINLTIGEKRAEVNGAWKEFDTQAALFNSRTMVPLRFISETLGAEVGWDGKLNRVDIWTKEGSGKPAEPKNPKAPAVTPYTGAKPINPREWKSASGTAEVFRWENPVIKYITIDDLPYELDGQNVMDIKVDDKFVNVMLRDETGHQSAPRMFLAEGNDITRVRTLKNFTSIDDYSYIQKYEIKDSYDTHKDMGNLPTECDIKKITHFIFEGRKDGQARLLAITNPYFGGNR